MAKCKSRRASTLLSPQDLEALDRVMRAMDQMRLEFGPNISARRVQALLTIGRLGASTHRRVAAELDAHDHTTLMDLQALGDLNRQGEHGYAMLQSHQEPAKRDRYVWSLTTKGKAVLDRLGAALVPAPR